MNVSISRECMLSTRILLLFLFVCFMPILPGFGQSSKPSIIRDTDIAEGVGESEEPKPKERNPKLANDNIKVGNYYYKRKNYAGAILRYLTAIEYQPDSDNAYKSLVKAYESLVEAYESMDRTRESLERAEEQYGLISSAINAFTEFLRVNTDSEKNDVFTKMVGKLKEVSSRFDNL